MTAFLMRVQIAMPAQAHTQVGWCEHASTPTDGRRFDSGCSHQGISAV